MKGNAKLNEELNYTKNLFGSLDDVKGRLLQVIDRNDRGDCLCLLPSKDNLIDVDYRDIQAFLPNLNEPINFMDFIKAMSL